MSDEKNKVDTTTEIKNSEMKKAEIKKADANVKTMEDFTSPEILYDELIASVKKYHPSTDISMIEKAYKIAYEAHEGQKRKSGEPYIIHPLCVAIILADLELDKETIVAGLRGLIADPEWVNKVEFGNVCDIRKCISCNIGCAGHRIGLNQPIRCTVNPAVNSGEDYMKTKVNKPCNVVVIGGGTAGLEAACTAAEVGCTTFLIEKKAELGGLASVISKIPDKKRLADFPNYMIHRASKLHNLFVFKNTSATVDMVKALNPDIIVNATGSVPTLPPITGLHDLVDKDGTNVATVLKMIERINEYPEDMKGQKIAIIGGGAVGLDVMEFFTERGAEVTMVEMLPMIGNGLDPVTKCDTNAKMAKYGVKQMTNTALQEVKNDRFIVKNPEGEIEEIPFDYGFICLGMRANTPVLSEIDEAFSNTNVEIVNIGDSKRARRIIEGTEEGRNILNVLARHDYL